MATKGKKAKSQSDGFFTKLNQLADKYSLKHIDKVIDKRDSPQIISLIIIFVLVWKVLPLAGKEKNLFFGQPYWLIFVSLMVLVLITIVILFKRDKKKKKKTKD